MARTITSWSWSRFSTWRDCPAKAKFKFIDRLEEPSGPAAERGTKLHKSAENYLKGTERLPADFKQIAVDMQRLKKSKADPEGSITLTKTWQMTTWNDWGNAWCRIQIDALLPPGGNKRPELLIIDYKSGKEKPWHEEQLELYAIGGFIKYPQATVARTQLWYIDSGVITPPDDSQDGVYHRVNLEKLKKAWEARVKPMMADTAFKPKPGNACRWCHFRKSNGGPCKY